MTTRCLLRTADLMVELRVLEALRAGGMEAQALDATAWSHEVASPDRADDRVVVAVVDLTAPDALEAIEEAVAAGVPVLAYGPHVEAELLERARAAGARAVYPRGQFLQHAAALVGAATG
jgi:hypothetical protein